MSASSPQGSRLNYPILVWFGLLGTFTAAAFYINYLWIKPLPESHRMAQANLVLSPSHYPPTLDTQTQPIQTLPDLNGPEQHQSTSLWYFIEFYPPQLTARKMAIYLPRFSQNAEIFLNGQWLGNGGSMTPPVSRNRNHNLIVNFDRSIALNQTNTLAIHLVGERPANTYLGDVYLGPESLLKQHALLSQHLNIDLVMVITLCLLFTSIFISILWLLRPADTYYLCYAIFSLLWVLHDYNHFIRNLPLPLVIWESLSSLAFGFSMLFVIFFIHRFEGSRPLTTERFLVVYVCVLALPFLKQNDAWIQFYAYTIWSPAIALLGCYGLYFLYKKYQRTKQTHLIPVIAGGLGIMIFGPHDLLLALRVLPKDSPFMMHFAAFLVVVIIATTLIKRFVSSMNVVEHYNQQLQREVDSKTSEMQGNYIEMQTLMRKYTVAEERQRLMRDIHDGIGGQLVGILASMDSKPMNPQQLKTDIKLALQDLRLVIDSLDDESEDLPTLLGMLRMRLSNQLSNAKLKLHWKVDELPRIDHFGSANVLHTMRIIQEAITNAIKHSGAKNLTIATELTEDKTGDQHACIIVSDDGCGNVSQESKGRGLLNMRKRAEIIGADLLIMASLGKGVSVRLEIPVNDARTSEKA